jgi:hypothetical protein
MLFLVHAVTSLFKKTDMYSITWISRLSVILYYYLILRLFVFPDRKFSATAPYFYRSILLRALKSKRIVLLTYVYKK